MKSKTFEILNDKNLLARKKALFNKLEDFYNGKQGENTLNLNGVVFFPQGVDPFTQPEQWVESALDFMAEHAERISADEQILRPCCIEFGPYGVHFIDKILGAEVFNLDGQWNNKYLTTPIGELQMPDLEKDETFNLVKRIAEHFVKMNVKFPILGLPTVASPLNIAVNLYGEEAFCAFYENEEGIMHDLRVICDLQKKIHQYYLKTLPIDQLQPVVSWERTQPFGCGQICGCSTQMLSADMYEEFISELDNELLGVYPNPGMIHLCGAHAQHVKTFAKMKNVKCLQLHNRAAEDLELWLKELREDQVLYVNCCEEMPYEKAFEISGGNRVVFVGEFAPKKRRI